MVTNDLTQKAFLTALAVAVIVMLFLLFTCISFVEYGYISYPVFYTAIGVATMTSFAISFISIKNRQPKQGEVASTKADAEVLASIFSLGSGVISSREVSLY
jgi:hypothetical protein